MGSLSILFYYVHAEFIHIEFVIINQPKHV